MKAVHLSLSLSVILHGVLLTIPVTKPEKGLERKMPVRLHHLPVPSMPHPISEPASPAKPVVKKVLPQRSAKKLPKKEMPPPPTDERDVAPEAEMSVVVESDVATTPFEETPSEVSGVTSSPDCLTCVDVAPGEASELSDIASSFSEEPLPVPSREEVWKDYLARLRGRIEAARLYPQQALRMGLEGKVSIQLVVGASGEITGVELVEPSPFPLLNRAAVELIRALSPLPPLPPGLGIRWR